MHFQTVLGRGVEVPTCSTELAPPGTPGEGGDAQAYHTRNGRARGIQPQGNSPFLSKRLLESAMHARERHHGSEARTAYLPTQGMKCELPKLHKAGLRLGGGSLSWRPPCACRLLSSTLAPAHFMSGAPKISTQSVPNVPWEGEGRLTPCWEPLAQIHE